MTDIVPRLRDDVSIRPFDAIEGLPRYVVAVDHRHFVVNDAVAALLEATREADTMEGLASRVSGVLGRRVTTAQAALALRERIPEVVFHAEKGSGLESPLRLRVRLFSGRALTPLLHVTSRLFSIDRVGTLLLAFVLLDVAVGVQLWSHGAEALAGASFVGVIGLVMAGVLIHELGHLSACHRYGARHGGIGFGLYWFMPAFYAEVHGAWMLSRKQRIVVDIGGVYFQCQFLLLLSAYQLWQPSATCLMAILCSHFLLLNTLNPVLKFDGYWLLSDLSGSHNLHARIRESTRLCWRRVVGDLDAPAPSHKELILVASFALLTTAYFAYVLAFMGHNLGSVAAGLSSSWESGGAWWVILLRSLGLSLLVVASLGIAFMLALRIREVIHASPQASEHEHVQVPDAVA